MLHNVDEALSLGENEFERVFSRLVQFTLKFRILGGPSSLADEEHQQRTRDVNREGRAYFEQSFAEMGLEYVPSHANFVLVRVGDGKAVFTALMKRGVIIRDMAAYGLPEWIRVSVGTMPQNERFIAELKALTGLAMGN